MAIILKKEDLRISENRFTFLLSFSNGSAIPIYYKIICIRLQLIIILVIINFTRCSWFWTVFVFLKNIAPFLIRYEIKNLFLLIMINICSHFFNFFNLETKVQQRFNKVKIYNKTKYWVFTKKSPITKVIL